MNKINLSYAAALVGAAYFSLLIVQAAPRALVYAAAALAGGALGALIYLVCFHFLPPNKPLFTLMSMAGMLLLIDEAIVHATAGAMAGAAIGMLSPLLTLPLTVKGLVVTVIGGLGSIPGAIVAGLLVGGWRICSSTCAVSPSVTSM